MRIIFRYEGGPLNGRTVYHALLPEKPEEVGLYRATTKVGEGEVLKEAGGDLTACGLYHLEERDVVLPEGLSEEVRAKAARKEWVAVHHPSEQDQEWAPVPEVPREKIVREKKEFVRTREKLVIPDDRKARLELLRKILTNREKEKEQQAKEGHVEG